MMKSKLSLLAAALAAALACALASAVQAQTAPKKTTTDVPPEILKSISIPDKVNTPIGTLDFFDGAPTDNTIKAVYDNLDRMRGFEVYLDNVGAVSIYTVLA